MAMGHIKATSAESKVQNYRDRDYIGIVEKKMETTIIMGCSEDPRRWRRIRWFRWLPQALAQSLALGSQGRSGRSIPKPIRLLVPISVST